MILNFDPTHDIDRVFWNSCISVRDGSRFIWNFSEMDKKVITKSVNGDMETIKNVYVYFFLSNRDILEYCVATLI